VNSGHYDFFLLCIAIGTLALSITQKGREWIQEVVPILLKAAAFLIVVKVIGTAILCLIQSICELLGFNVKLVPLGNGSDE
jgi:hypothetical protein